MQISVYSTEAKQKKNPSILNAHNLFEFGDLYEMLSDLNHLYFRKKLRYDITIS